MEQPPSPVAGAPADPTTRLELDQLTAIALGADPRHLSLVQLYAGLRGRIPRRTYWLHGVMSLLVLGLVARGLLSIANVDPELAGKIVDVLIAWPCIAVSAKRLHDFDFSAWWLLINLTGIGLVVMLVAGCVPGTRGPNRFGSDPREALARARINSAH